MILSLAHRLDRWTKQGLITEQQAKQILDFEKEVGGRPWVVMGVMGIGITAVVTGMISLVAANWDTIPAWFKIVGYFILQIIPGFLFFKNEKKSGVWRETFLALFAFLFWAGIGLFSQVFNLKGEGWQACVLWLVMTLPAVCIARHSTLPHLWTMILEATTLWWMAESYLPIFDEKAKAMIAVSVPIALSAIGFWAQAYRIITPYLKEAFTFWGIGLFATGGIILGNILWEVGDWIIPYHDLKYLLIPWITLGMGIGGSLARKGKVRNDLCYLTAAFLFGLGLYLTLPTVFPVTGDKVIRQLIGATGFIGLGTLAAIISAMADMKRLYQTATRLIALRFVVVYFQVFGSLTQTGVGLVFSGVVVLGVAYFWRKIQPALMAKLKSLGEKK